MTDRLTVRDAARILAMRDDSVRRALREGRLEGHRMGSGRWWMTREQVDDYLHGRVPGMREWDGTEYRR